MMLTTKQTTLLYTVFLFLCFLPMVSPAVALLGGIVLSLLNIKLPNVSAYTSKVLQASIVCMGFGMNLTQVVEASKGGFLLTALSVVTVMFCGVVLGKLFKVDSTIALLISAGTAICGGSAIAAVSPVVQAKSHEISFSLIVVFILNAIALLLFPYVGHQLHLSQEVFGNWAAIAIHDTSSVVGAGAIYGEKALQVATTVKLIRALWIIPLSLVIAFSRRKQTSGKFTFPWFILLFAFAVLVAYFFPSLDETFSHLNWLGKRGMVVALFLIGSSISFSDIKKAGARSFLLGVLLWFVIALGSILYLMSL